MLECSAFVLLLVPFDFTDTAVFPDREPYHLRLYREHANEFDPKPEKGAIFLGRYRVKDLPVSLDPGQEEGQCCSLTFDLWLPVDICTPVMTSVGSNRIKNYFAVQEWN